MTVLTVATVEQLSPSGLVGLLEMILSRRVVLWHAATLLMVDSDLDLVDVSVSQLLKVVWCLDRNPLPCSHSPASLDDADELRCGCSLVWDIPLWRFPQLVGTKPVCAREACVEHSNLIAACCSAAWSIDLELAWCRVVECASVIVEP
eukprot:932484-Rhodomonas_salina.1